MFAHAVCLLRLRRLACELYDTASPLPTLNRPLTLNEFLLSKRPRSDIEILCCLAFHLQHHNSKMKVNAKTVQQQLRVSAFKIPDPASALLEGTDKFGYLKRVENEEPTHFVLTEKGLQFVRRLPAEPE